MIGGNVQQNMFLFTQKIETTFSAHRTCKAESPKDGRCIWLFRRKLALWTKDQIKLPSYAAKHISWLSSHEVLVKPVAQVISLLTSVQADNKMYEVHSPHLGVSKPVWISPEQLGLILQLTLLLAVLGRDLLRALPT